MMGPLTGYRVWFAEKYQQRANSWMLMVANIGFVSSTLPVQILLPYMGWRWIFILIAILILISIILIFLFTPNWEQTENSTIDAEKKGLAEIWKNKFFISMVPLAFINYGGIQAIQTLWAGPWMLNITGYSPFQSATGLFWINVTMLASYFLWGYILPKLSDYGISSIKLIKFGLPISYFVFFLIIFLGTKAGALLFAIYIMTSIVISLTQPAIALNFSQSLAGKSLTSYNVFIHSGTFFMQWGIGLFIDLFNSKGFNILSSYRISFSIYLILCILSYIFFIYLNKKND
mgnify:FL=1